MSKRLSFSTPARLLNTASGVLPEHRKGKKITVKNRLTDRGVGSKLSPNMFQANCLPRSPRPTPSSSGKDGFLCVEYGAVA
jgi:hypothetical protein